MKILSNKSFYSIGLMSCESIDKPYLNNFLPYKEVSHFKTFHWSRHVSVASSLKGGGKFIAPPIVPYIAGPCSMWARTILLLSN